MDNSSIEDWEDEFGMTREQKAIIEKLRRQIKDHDFLAETPHDNWLEEVQPLFADYLHEYLSKEELVKINYEEHYEAYVAAIAVVQREFINWLVKYTID